MSAMSELSIELENLQDEAWDAAMVLEQKLGAISNLLWQDGDMAPCLQAPAELLAMLASIQAELATPMLEIEGTV